MYESMGLQELTSIAAWINSTLMQRFGEDYSRKIIREYGEALKNE